MSKDLYGVLGIDKSASDADIKKAYRNLARKYHPDVNKESGAETKFKEVQSAYDILSNPQKKAQFDQYGVTDDSASQGFGGFSGFNGFGGGGGFGDLDDIIDSFFNGVGGRRSSGQGRRQQHAERGDDLRYDLEITLEDAVLGVKKDINIYHLEACSSCKGQGAQSSSDKITCPQCNGVGQVKTVQRTLLGSFSQVTVCPACHGQGHIIKNPCHSCKGAGTSKVQKRIDVTIPAGVDTDTRLRVSGEGNSGPNGGPSGDLYVFITVKSHKYFKRHEQDLILELELPFSQLALGTEIEVPTINGSAMLKIPSGTQTNTTFRFKGKGIPSLRGYGNGDQHIIVKGTVPRSLSSREKDLLEEFSRLRQDNRKASSLYEFVKSV